MNFTPRATAHEMKIELTDIMAQMTTAQLREFAATRPANADTYTSNKIARGIIYR